MDILQQNNEITGNKGVSNSTILVLISLALIMTVIGTWAIINSIQDTEVTKDVNYGTNVGKISFSIVPIEKYSDKASGLISLEIKS